MEDESKVFVNLHIWRRTLSLLRLLAKRDGLTLCRLVDALAERHAIELSIEDDEII